jgi:hypothetical protein
MDKLFAQCADLGVFHLETMCIAGEWEWWVLNMKERVEVGRGRSASLGGAIIAAERLVGGEPEWRDIGPEVTDEKKKEPPTEAGAPSLEVRFSGFAWQGSSRRSVALVGVVASEESFY